MFFPLEANVYFSSLPGMLFPQLLLFFSSQLRKHLFQGAFLDPRSVSLVFLPWSHSFWVPRSRALGCQEPVVTVDLASPQ